jgi:hypothetical protein
VFVSESGRLFGCHIEVVQLHDSAPETIRLAGNKTALLRATSRSERIPVTTTVWAVSAQGGRRSLIVTTGTKAISLNKPSVQQTGSILDEIDRDDA